MQPELDRRLFFGTSAAALGYFFTAPAYSAVRAADKPNDKIHFAGVGVGGKGSSDIDQAGNLGEVVAICDIDEKTLEGKAKKFPQAKKYFDYRKMLEEMGKTIDAVTVSTPDHTHAHPSIMAMRMKKHVYCQKPLTHSVFEARLMRETAKKFGVATQMGNQGTAENGLRRAVELIRGNIIGKVTEVHVWTNRPVWPQAPDYKARPDYTDEVPAHVHWEEFIGPAPMRPYVSVYRDGKSKGKPVYHSFSWRGWWDFGTGALGDMACHTANMAFMALKLGYPKTVEGEAGDLNSETCPSWARVLMEFPARGDMPAVKWHWYEGKKDGKKVLPPQELLAKVLRQDQKLADSGSILVGTKGILFSPNDYGAQFILLPDDIAKDVNTKIPEILPINGKGDQGMKNEWVEAMRSGRSEVAMSNFDYAGMLTEAVLLGNVAMRVGKKLEWDGPNLKCTNCSEADQFIKRQYRKGWELTESA